METMFDNLINGNLATAKKQAKRFNWGRIFEYARNDLGWSEAKSLAVTRWIKGETTFQSYCDAE